MDNTFLDSPGISLSYWKPPPEVTSGSNFKNNKSETRTLILYFLPISSSFPAMLTLTNSIPSAHLNFSSKDGHLDTCMLNKLSKLTEDPLYDREFCQILERSPYKGNKMDGKNKWEHIACGWWYFEARQYLQYVLKLKSYICWWPIGDADDRFFVTNIIIQPEICLNWSQILWSHYGPKHRWKL